MNVTHTNHTGSSSVDFVSEPRGDYTGFSRQRDTVQGLDTTRGFPADASTAFVWSVFGVAFGAPFRVVNRACLLVYRFILANESACLPW
jgi:hypothetical protein